MCTYGDIIKRSRDGVLELSISAYQNVFEICVDTLGDDYIFSMLMYVDSIKNIEVGERLHKFVVEVFKNKNDIAMTYGQFLKQEAKQEGLEKGREEGILTKAIAVAKNMLLKFKIDIDTVQQVTELPKAELEKILQASR